MSEFEKYLGPFLRSGLFEGFVRELVNRVENTLELPDPNKWGRRRRGQGTNSGSDMGSCGSRESAPAWVGGGGDGRGAPSRTGVAARLPSTTSTLSLESDPGALYRVPSSASAGLSLGRVDALGHYSSAVDADLPPERRDRKTKVQQAIKGLVHSENPRDQALANQVAGLIVSDILSTAAQAPLD